MQGLAASYGIACPMCHRTTKPVSDRTLLANLRPQRQHSLQRIPFTNAKTHKGLQRKLPLCQATDVQQQEATSDTDSDIVDTKGEVYEVTLTKPLGLRFARGNDGGCYVNKSDPALGNTDDQIQAGDKILKCSASFGNDIWDAKQFGNVVYAIKTRNGAVYLQLQSNGGDLSVMKQHELSVICMRAEVNRDAETDASKQWQQERSGGNYGEGTREMQKKNYISKKESERKRRELFDDALEKFAKKDIEGALVDFEEVLGMEPPNFVGDDFSRVTQIYRVTQFNIACCYSSMGQIDNGLEALQASMRSGFEQFQKIRTDPNLDNLRKDERFKKMVDNYDEPVFDTGAFKALKNIFSFGKK